MPLHPAAGEPERIGLLGGTFDPPHLGHLAAARACRSELGLDRVLLVVANDPWQKVPVRSVTPAALRYEMVAALLAGEAGSADGIEACPAEIDRGGPSYTVDTVRQLHAAAASAGRPPPVVYMVIGADLVDSLPTWERVDELRQLVTLAIVSRPRSPTPSAPDGWRSVVVDGVGVDVSSSEVRALLAEGRPVSGLLSDGVVRCIRRHGLYAVGR